MNQVGHIRAQPDRAHSMHQNTPFSSKKIIPINIWYCHRINSDYGALNAPT